MALKFRSLIHFELVLFHFVVYKLEGIFTHQRYIERQKGREKEKTLSPVEHGHTEILSPSLLHSVGTLGKHMRVPGMFFKLPELGFKPHSQLSEIQLP